MVSFDVVSLFTAIPVDKACDYIKIKLEQDASLPSRTNLDINDIISLLLKKRSTADLRKHNRKQQSITKHCKAQLGRKKPFTATQKN